MDRPYIYCHMMSSIDGKITYGKIKGEDSNSSAFDDFYNIYVKVESELNPKVLMCGRVTMEMFAIKEETVFEDGPVEEDFIVKNESGDYFIGLDTKGVLRWKNGQLTLKVGADLQDGIKNLIIIVTKQTPRGYLNYLKSKSVSYITCGDAEVDFEYAFKKLKDSFGIENIVVEGGGVINGSVSEFIDEISLLILPFVVKNSAAPSVFEKEVTEVDLDYFELVSNKTIENGVVSLRYKRKI